MGPLFVIPLNYVLASLGSFTALGDLLRGRADRSKHTQRVVMHWRSYRLLFAQQVGFIMVDPVSRYGDGPVNKKAWNDKGLQQLTLQVQDFNLD